MSKVLKEIRSNEFPSDFISEVSKSALHALYQSNNKSLINLESIVSFDNLIELNENEKLTSAEKIFSNVESSTEPEVNNNKEAIYL
jgi:hypothetical protein